MARYTKAQREAVQVELTRLMNKGLELEDAVVRMIDDNSRPDAPYSATLIEEVAEKLETPKLDPTRVLSRIELIAVFALAGYAPREADLAVLERLGATIENVADYCWDHLMGEPRTPSLAKVQRTIQAAVDRFPKPEPVKPAPEPEVWTYAIVDLDLIRDDSSSAAGVLPDYFWPSREAARNALEAHLRERWHDYGHDENEDGTPNNKEMPALVLTDNPYDKDGLHGTPDWLDDVELYVYRMRPAPTGEALHPDEPVSDTPSTN